MKIRELTKQINQVVTGLGTSMLVSQALDCLVPIPAKIPARILIGVGKMAIGGAVAFATVKYTETIIDDLFDEVEKIKAVNKIK